MIVNVAPTSTGMSGLFDGILGSVGSIIGGVVGGPVGAAVGGSVGSAISGGGSTKPAATATPNAPAATSGPAQTQVADLLGGVSQIIAATRGESTARTSLDPATGAVTLYATQGTPSTPPQTLKQALGQSPSIPAPLIAVAALLAVVAIAS